MEQRLVPQRLRRVRSPDGTPIACWRAGRGRQLAAVHGVTIDHTCWDGLRAQLEQQHTLVAIDRRGHGASGHGDGEYSLECELEDLLAVLDDADDSMDLLAHSYGGLIALEAALRSSRVRRLVLYEPSIDDDPDFPAVLDRVTALVASGEDEQAAATLLVERSGLPPEAIDTVRGLPLWPILLRGAQVLPREGQAIVAYRFEAHRFAELTNPTLILVGSESPAWRHEAMHALDAALPHSELHALAGQGHLATHTAPELLASETLRFLNRT
jgi:pimeloyl-ACP methyl ester carboxylesterase